MINEWDTIVVINLRVKLGQYHLSEKISSDI